MGILPDDIKPAMQGILPSHLTTCSLDGTPNTSVVSQVYYVDPDHVALSYQFFSKTIKNIKENPRALAWLTNPETLDTWELEIEYDHSETSGPVFDVMDMQIEAIASMTGMKGIFKLRAADIYRVLSANKTVGERLPLAEIPQTSATK
jgi:hypothetical protein